MPIVQLIISAAVAVLFLMAFFVVAWYVVVPLIIIWAIWMGVQVLLYHWRVRSGTPSDGGETVRLWYRRRRKKQATVIDAEYSEIK